MFCFCAHLLFIQCWLAEFGLLTVALHVVEKCFVILFHKLLNIIECDNFTFYNIWSWSRKMIPTQNSWCILELLKTHSCGKLWRYFHTKGAVGLWMYAHLNVSSCRLFPQTRFSYWVMLLKCQAQLSALAMTAKTFCIFSLGKTGFFCLIWAQ